MISETIESMTDEEIPIDSELFVDNISVSKVVHA